MSGEATTIKRRGRPPRRAIDINITDDGQVTSAAPAENNNSNNTTSTNGNGVPARKPRQAATAIEMSDTYVGSDSLQAALCAARSACRAVDIAMSGEHNNVFVCTRPPGHHAGRYGCTKGCLSTGFCLLNNAAIALTYARVRWGLERVAVVDIDIHYGNGTAEIVRGDPRAFFASIHMIYGPKNCGCEPAPVKEASHVSPSVREGNGFYPNGLGATEISDRFIAVGVYPKSSKGNGQYCMPTVSSSARMEIDSSAAEEESHDHHADAAELEREADERARACLFRGSSGFREALASVVLPKLERFAPELLIISGDA